MTRTPKEAGAASRKQSIKVDSAKELHSVDESMNGQGFSFYTDSFVRLRPTAGATAEHVKTVVDGLRAVGATVKLVAAQAGPALVAGNPGVTQPATLMTTRELVRTMAEESTSQRKEALIAYLDTLADRAGV